MNARDAIPSRRILVVDDNAAIHEDFRKILTKTDEPGDDFRQMEAALFGADESAVETAAFEIDCAFQGCEGLEMVERARSEGRPYAVAFVDGRMPPGWDGVETVARFWEASPDLQIVFCTAYADYSWDEIRRAVGESDSLLILKKPFDNVEVLQLAHALTRKWELNREVEGRLNRLAYFDSLTGLPNRVLFLDRLGQTLERARRYGHKSALMFIDLDNFKRVNDTLGHGVGDELLKIAALRIGECLRGSDTLSRQMPEGMAARLGGDEFTVVLSELSELEDAARVARRITEHLGRPIPLVGQQLIVTPSIGIAVFPRDGEDVETLLKNADLAMYSAKGTAAGSFMYYRESMNALARKKLTLETELRRSLERGEFRLHYQPQFDLATGGLEGMEALLRWRNRQLGEVPAEDFIPVAEESGLIVPIGEWAMRTACRTFRRWLDRGLDSKRIAVNVSMRQFVAPDFARTVADILEETGIEGRRLEIEFRECFPLRNAETVFAVLNTLRGMDIRIAVDDFGNGHSSLGLLKTLPIDELKIDRSLVAGIGRNRRDPPIICGIVAMAAGMDLTVIAEGVETTAQMGFLRENRCGQAQGYLFGRPMDVDRAEAYLRRRRAVSATEGGDRPAD